MEETAGLYSYTQGVVSPSGHAHLVRRFKVLESHFVEPMVRLRTISPIKKASLGPAFVIGGDGGNRTRVRKSSAFGSTCLEPFLI